jgi:hypothetical protein
MSDRSSSGTNASGNAASGSGAAPGTGTENLTEQGKEAAGQIQEQAGRLVDLARDQVSTRLVAQKDRAAGGADSLALVLQQVAQQFRQQDQGTVAQYVDSAAWPGGATRRYAPRARHRPVGDDRGPVRPAATGALPGCHVRPRLPRHSLLQELAAAPGNGVAGPLRLPFVGGVGRPIRNGFVGHRRLRLHGLRLHGLRLHGLRLGWVRLGDRVQQRRRRPRLRLLLAAHLGRRPDRDGPDRAGGHRNRSLGNRDGRDWALRIVGTGMGGTGLTGSSATGSGARPNLLDQR